MILFRFNKLAIFKGLFIGIVSAFVLGIFSEIAQSVELLNGATVEIYTPKELEDFIKVDEQLEGFALLELPTGEVYRLITDISDPSIANKGDGRFYPFDYEMVLRALNDIDVDGRKLDIVANVYILPYPVSGYLKSFVSENSIFLSPGTGEVDYRTVSFVVAHEFGHLFQHRYMPLSDSLMWERYMRLRGIKGLEPIYSNTFSHSDNPVEIFAEDFRVLFGSDQIESIIYIENVMLAPPQEVSGLREFFLGLVSDDQYSLAPHLDAETYNYPNPFNPTTTIVVELPEGYSKSGEIGLNIYDVRGSVVRTIRDYDIEGSLIKFFWDGRSNGGLDVKSGVYLYTITVGPSQIVRGKMILVR